jgi:ribosomal protein S18 acetylase RimI-like enzyme
MTTTITIRKAVSTDAPQIGKIYTDSWKMTYKGIVPNSFLDDLNPSVSAKKFASDIVGSPKKRFVYVVDMGKTVVGFAMGGPQKENPDKATGQIHDIYLVSDYQGQGVGRKLLSACAEELSIQGFQKMILYVLEDNPYQRFYESAGGVLEPHDGQTEIGGQNFKLLKYAWDLKKS